jgi:hypothetical protein
LCGPGQATAQSLVARPEAATLFIRADSSLDSRDVRLGHRLSASVTYLAREDALELNSMGSRIEGPVSIVQAPANRSPGILAMEEQGLTLPDEKVVVFEGRIASLNPAEQRNKGRDSQRVAYRRVLFAGGRDDARPVVTSETDPLLAVDVRYRPDGIPALTPGQAGILRRNAHTLARRWRNQIGVSSTGRLNPYRSYDAAELELHFALSAFADIASEYDRTVRSSYDAERLARANLELMGAARRVDEAFRWVWVPALTLSAWRSIQSTLTTVRFGYSG